MNNKSLTFLLLVVTIFSIAMGLLESAVVIYLRKILYPEGFGFPLSPVTPDLILTELLREGATLIMLLGIGFLAGRNASERFAWFLYSFAIWDIFYYVFLWLLIGWPESLMTYDVLFLLPSTWIGPVITPVIVSTTMIGFALLILVLNRRREGIKIPGVSWLALITGSVVLILGFIWDYSSFIMESMTIRDIWTLPKEQVLELATQYIPRKFNWFLFILGELVILSGILGFYLRFHSGSSD
ncbi:MAG: hypothetical protein AMS23_08405 [Bacteroides sp. SM1_62]|nr:MAG: hypothetical protein AMS26_08235 [Bacteroides sp. SM23_62]KPL22096.1 MAG: hypothetical protein AMS23_08405 [Bacteroides sp. SM1_62]